MPQMNKILIIGCPGAGKTTFATRLKDKLALPLFHLDAIWHKADRTHISRQEFDRKLEELLSLEAFILDGNYSRTLARRMAACDTVFLFDLPTELCLAGALSRLGIKRNDIPFVDTTLDPHLQEEIIQFREKNLPEIYALLEAYRDTKTIIIFKSREEAECYLESETGESLWSITNLQTKLPS